MTRIRTDSRGAARGLIRSCLAVALSLPFVTPVGAARADQAEARSIARGHFNRGVELAKAGDYEAALAEFEQAYRTSPHFSVLYNIGQAELALGRSSLAVETLRRYLTEGGEQIEPARRAEVESLIAGERQRLEATEGSPELAPAPDPSQPQSPPAAAAVTPPRSEPPPSAPVPPARGADDERADAKRPVSYVLGAAGIVLASAAVAHYAWNRGRYAEWQQAYAAYHEDPRPPRRSAANELAESIDRASRVTAGLAIGAGVMLGSGAVLFFSSSAASTDQVSERDHWLGVRGVF